MTAYQLRPYGAPGHDGRGCVLVWSALNSGGSLAARYLLPWGAIQAAQATEARGRMRLPRAGTLTQLYAYLDVATAAADITYTLRVNGVNTALTVTIANGILLASDLNPLHNVVVAKNDHVSIRSVCSVADSTVVPWISVSLV